MVWECSSRLPIVELAIRPREESIQLSLSVAPDPDFDCVVINQLQHAAWQYHQVGGLKMDPEHIILEY